MTRRIVLDTSVLVAAFRSSSGASFALLALAQQRRFRLIASPAIFLEYEAVLKRDEHRLVHKLSDADLDAFLIDFSRYVEPARIYFRWRSQLQDPQDEMVLEAALNGRADAIVTHNARDFEFIGERFGVRILLPRQFLEEVSV